MLSNYPIDVVLLAMDLAAAKDFYADKIGLRVLSESPGGVTFHCGGDSQLVVTKSSVGTKDEQTQATFRVADVRAEGSCLRKRGVKIEDYVMPGLQTQGGIADIGFAWMAWFLDPGQNCVGLMQLENPLVPLLRATTPSSLLRRRTWRTKRPYLLEGSSRGAAEKEKDACIIV